MILPDMSTCNLRGPFVIFRYVPGRGLVILSLETSKGFSRTKSGRLRLTVVLHTREDLLHPEKELLIKYIEYYR